LSIISYDYPPNGGGISRLASSIVEQLASRDCAFEVLTIDSGEKESRDMYFPCTKIVSRKRIFREIGTLRYLMALQQGTHILNTVWHPEATLCWLSGIEGFVVMAHGNEVMPYPTGIHFELKSAIRRRVLNAARIVICNSQYTEGLVRAISPSANTTVILPAVDSKRFNGMFHKETYRRKFGLPESRRIILSVSRIETNKGHDTVIRAISLLTADVRKHVHYVVAGQGEHLPVLKRLADELNVAESITWLGFVDEGALPALYACADLFVLCTREDREVRAVEGFGMVFLEAQASGVPVVGTRAGGIPDAIEEGSGGWLVPVDDAVAVSVHFHSLVENIEEYQLQGERGRERVLRESNWQSYVDKLMVLMEKSYD